MIVGNGMISKSFKSSNIDISDICIFASGVPDSNEINDKEYEREFNLIKKVLKDYPLKKLIYFSTSSIETGEKSKYINFKLNIEKYILSNFKNCLILRLPIVVGKTLNKSQLVPYLNYHLLNNLALNIKRNCYRYLIDVEDLPKIVDLIVKSNTKLNKITVNYNNKISVVEIVDILSKMNNLKTKKVNYCEYHTTEKFSKNNDFIKLIDKHDFNTKPVNILSKYYKNND